MTFYASFLTPQTRQQVGPGDEASPVTNPIPRQTIKSPSLPNLTRTAVEAPVRIDEPKHSTRVSSTK